VPVDDNATDEFSTHGEKPPINIPQTMGVTQLNNKQGA
jgi:hypothetical protein